MKRGLLIAFVVLAALGLLFYSSFKGTYNRLVEYQENINGRWSQVQNVYQRRADLIPNVVEAVKGAKEFEQETLQAVVDARAKVGQVKIGDDVTGDPEKLAEYERAQAQLGSSIGRLLAVSENYPELKATELFRDLIVELEGAENRIAVERKRFIDAIQAYNTYRRKFPNNIYASLFGFEKMTYYEADAGAEKAPKVAF